MMPYTNAWVDRIACDKVSYADLEYDNSLIKSGNEVRLLTIRKTNNEISVVVNLIPEFVYYKYIDGLVSSINQVICKMENNSIGMTFIKYADDGDIVVKHVYNIQNS